MNSIKIFDETNNSTEELVDTMTHQTIEIAGYLNNNNFSIETNQDKKNITINFTGLIGNIKITILLQNTKRSIAYNYIFRSNTSSFSKTIDVSFYPEGTYYLKIQIADNPFIHKVILH